MNYTMPELVEIPGEDLWKWRENAKLQAIEYRIDPQEVDWLLKGLLHLDSLTLRLQSDPAGGVFPSSVSLDRLSQLWRDRLIESTPVQYLVGSTPWRDLDLIVTPDVLIPRPETELIIDIAGQISTPEQQSGIWVDLGTGSGAIAIALAQAMPRARIIAVDTSPAALKIAQANIDRYALGDRIQCQLSDWWSNLAPWRSQFSGMVANPPYIPTSIVLELQPEVLLHEPHLALDGGNDGLDAVRQLIATAPDYLVAGGIWLVELMAGQSATVQSLLTENGHYTGIHSIADLAGHDRFVAAISS
jgi:release factor glutamine methyltransferase